MATDLGGPLLVMARRPPRSLCTPECTLDLLAVPGSNDDQHHEDTIVHDLSRTLEGPVTATSDHHTITIASTTSTSTGPYRSPSTSHVDVAAVRTCVAFHDGEPAGPCGAV
jgi:hypothetical protein